MKINAPTVTNASILGAATVLVVLAFTLPDPPVEVSEPDPILLELREQNNLLRDLLESKVTEDDIRTIVTEMLPEQRVVTVNGDMTDFLVALRHEADLLIEWPKKHESKSGSVYVNNAASTGFALSRVYNRLVNDCEYHLYNFGEDDDGKLKYNIRRIDSDCAD